ncbi:MAG: pentapeptide repeat-containing protein, partial [Proteobacteria bacterium]|nr:pentapeptide repeat-containing protein [Pseudomonadota bacterium]
MVPGSYVGRKAPCPQCRSEKTLIRPGGQREGKRTFFARFGLALAAAVVFALVGGAGYFFLDQGGRGLSWFSNAPASRHVDLSPEIRPEGDGTSPVATGVVDTPRFAGKDFHGSNFAGKNLRGLNFQNANFEGANLRDTDLRGVNFSQANLLSVDLREADLRGAILVGARLGKADLSQARLGGANLTDADLSRSNLRG